jgi:hypothetical protein
MSPIISEVNSKKDFNFMPLIGNGDETNDTARKSLLQLIGLLC